LYLPFFYLDALASIKLEDLMRSLVVDYTIVIVTHNMQQAARVSDMTAFMLMDEPCSALDLIATGRIEDLMRDLKDRYTIVIVTHNMQQAARVSDFTGYFLLGELIEFDETDRIFTNPADSRTEDYITGRFG